MLASSLLRLARNKARRLQRSAPFQTGRSFAKDESGAIAIIFALTLIPILLLIGVAIDYSRIALDRSEVQTALDAATLAAVKKVGILNDSEIRSMIGAYVVANTPNSIKTNIDVVEIKRNPNALRVQASGETKTTFMLLADVEKADFKADSSAVASDKSIEVSLVLDNSGSMGGSRLWALKNAAKELVTILEENQQNSEDLSIGIVPFNHLVRLDSNDTSRSWLDKDASASIHRNNLPPKSKRFDLFSILKDPYTYKAEEWEGCVEARKHPQDIKDTAASSGNPETFFQPFFYPDTREPNNRYDNSYNDYLPKNDYPSGMTWTQKKKYGWYYKQKFSKGRGPNYSCYVQRILPLTTNMNTVRSHINSLSANGNTNIHLGTIWGLRLLSQQAPYSQGKSYDDDENVKFMIVMSDGANTYGGYQAYGWAADGRISGSGSTTSEMNKRTLEACTAAKDKEVIVYTIAYGNIGSSTTKMLRDCATLPENAFTPQSTSDMINVFKEIAAALNVIRLTD
ncbi:vWA domain-containing protein [Cohaesibacter intestini]|uniref:vWA domain-containing protein n=1 Tax=Cohaesibacter intestini TaxID=2211145 RepID=UPI001300A2E1|nr:VWA domain-containing protein [Cohaesibacter intestini]